MPAVREYPKVIFSESAKMREFLGFNVGTYPPLHTPVNSMFDMLGQIAPMTYPVSATTVSYTLLTLPTKR